MTRGARMGSSQRLSLALTAFLFASCRGANNATGGDTASAAGNLAHSRDSAASTMVRGTVSALSGNDLAVQSDSGTVHVRLSAPVLVYDRQPATLARVTPNAFVGVTTVKQADGSERATEIHVFPEALRGLGEGSRPMAQASGSTMTNGRTMTNGAMTNGSASGSTMSNGSVGRAEGSTIVVQYAGGSKTVTVPAATTVTEIVLVSKSLAVGDRVVVVAARRPNGSLITSQVLLASNK